MISNRPQVVITTYFLHVEICICMNATGVHNLADPLYDGYKQLLLPTNIMDKDVTIFLADICSFRTFVTEYQI